MLNRCAPGWRFNKITHFRQVIFNEKVFNLPSKEDEIYLVKVAKMVREFGLVECAEKELKRPMSLPKAEEVESKKAIG